MGPSRLAEAHEGSSVALARLGDLTIAYSADEDADALYTIDVTTGQLRAVTPLVGSPSQVVVLADGRVAVTIRNKNRLQILEPTAKLHQPLTSLCAVKTPVEPVGVTTTPTDDAILVSSAWARQLSAFDGRTLEHRFSSDLAREPRDIVVDDDGRRAFVAHVVGGQLSVVDLDSDEHEVRTVDLQVKRSAGSSTMGAPRQSCQGFALAKSSPLALAAHHDRLEGRIFAPRVTIDPGEPTQRTTGYGGNSFASVESPIVSVVDSAAERTLTRVLVETEKRQAAPQKGACLLPRSAKMSAATEGLLVACAGSNTLVELDPRGTDPARLERQRWKVPAGPTGVAVDDARGVAVVWSQFERQLAIIDLQSDNPKTAVDVVSAPRLTSASLSEEARWGRRLFHQTDDARISRDGRACASCHPDGREDALTWSTPVGPRQTIMLAGRVRGSGPFSWMGTHETVEVHLRNTFERLGGTGLPQARNGELAALVSYVQAMPGPNLEDALPSNTSKLVARGKGVFFAQETGCATCHHAGSGTDQQTHDLASRAPADSDGKFDTPSLRYVGGTAPYFHDGRYPSLLSLLTSVDSQMGHTIHLSRRDAEALAAFLETL